MSGGEESNNIATGKGGGVYVSGGDFTMTNGTISNNRATEEGGGVYITNGEVNISGGNIYERHRYRTCNCI